MNKRYLIAISIIGIAIILFSLFSVSLFSKELLSKKNEQQDLLEIIIITDPSSGNAPLHVHFKPVINGINEEMKDTWDFGDGTVSNEKTPTHIYTSAGEYDCKLTVRDGECNVTDNVKINVLENNPPIIKIIVDKTSGNRPMTVNFDVDGFDTDGEIISYDWEIIYPPFFSNQKITTHTEKNFSERFIRPGLYEVKLTVNDDYGNAVRDYLKIQVLNNKLEMIVLLGISYYNMYLGLKGFYDRFFGSDSLDTSPSFIERTLDLFGGT
jgi:PKD repeat protein